MKTAIVLSGGGAKGAYQIGVWHALRKLGIKYDIVTGTSVGALNGALMVQNEYSKAKRMWYNINFSMLFHSELFNDVTTYKGKIEIFKMYLSNIVLGGGMDVSKLEAMMDNYINHRKFYKSKVDFGLITVNLSNFKPVALTKKDIPKEQLRDYLMASATCFPAFKLKHIDDDLFIDGAYYDALPINQAIDMGATNIIAVDLNSFGIKRKVTVKNIPITYIQPRNKLDSFLYFHGEFTRRSIKLGYNDAMKTFNKLDGNKYTFKRNHLNKNFDKLFLKFKANLENMLHTKKSKSLTTEILNRTKYYSIIQFNEKASKRIINSTIEYLGLVFKIDETDIYSIDKFNELLIEKIYLLENFNLNLIEEKIKNKEIIKLADKGYLIKYLFSKLLVMDEISKVKRDLCNFSLLLDKDILAAIYIYTLIQK